MWHWALGTGHPQTPAPGDAGPPHSRHVEAQRLHHQALAETLHGELGGRVDVIEDDAWMVGELQSGLGGGWSPQGSPFSPTLQAHDAADDDDVAPAASLHVGQHLLDQADEAEEVGVHEALHGCQALALQGSRHAHPSIADCGARGINGACPG